MILKLERIKQGISQKELAKECGISVQYLSALENGRKTNPSKKIMMRISEKLGKSIKELFFNENDNAIIGQYADNSLGELK